MITIASVSRQYPDFAKGLGSENVKAFSKPRRAGVLKSAACIASDDPQGSFPS